MKNGKMKKKYAKMFENMQKFLKICINTSKHAKNMQKSKICKKYF